MKDGACVINLGECKSLGIHQIALYVNSDNATYFDSFGVEYIHRQQKYHNNIYRRQANESVMCRYFCVFTLVY